MYCAFLRFQSGAVVNSILVHCIPSPLGVHYLKFQDCILVSSWDNNGPMKNYSLGHWFLKMRSIRSLKMLRNRRQYARIMEFSVEYNIKEHFYGFKFLFLHHKTETINLSESVTYITVVFNIPGGMKHIKIHLLTILYLKLWVKKILQL
jgi:hypothetical protein